MGEQLYEYEIEDDNGIVTTVQLTEEDAKNRFPNARKKGAAPATTVGKSDDTAKPGTTQQQGDVKNRARR